MKGLLPIVGVLILTIFPVQAGVHISVSLGGGGGFRSGNFCNTGYRCGYAPSCYSYRGWNYYYPYAYNYGYAYGGYPYYAPDYSVISYSPSPISYIPPQPPAAEPAPQAAAATPAPVAAPAPPPAPMEYGILDVNGFVHSPYSDAIFKVPGVRNAQMVYDPVTGKPFLVR